MKKLIINICEKIVKMSRSIAITSELIEVFDEIKSNKYGK